MWTLGREVVVNFAPPPKPGWCTVPPLRRCGKVEGFVLPPVPCTLIPPSVW